DVLLLEPGTHRVRVTFGEQSQVVSVEVTTVKQTVIGLEPWRIDEPERTLEVLPVKPQAVGYSSARHTSTIADPELGSATPLYSFALGSWAVSAASFGVALAAGLDA